MTDRMKTQLLIGITLSLVASSAASSGVALTVQDPQCEYRTNPLGIDTLKPRLSWILKSEVRGQRQTAYQVLAATHEDELSQDRADLWDSGKVESDQSVHIVYQGRPLQSGMRCYWKVRVWDRENRASAWSTPTSWSMGILRSGDWQGQWIGATDQRGRTSSSRLTGYHAAEAAKGDELKWVQVDLGAVHRLDKVTLYPPTPPGFEDVEGFGFPLRFRIEASGDSDFSQSWTLVDFTEKDYPNPGNEPCTFAAGDIRARYVRITATRLWNRARGSHPFCFALAELEVWSEGANVALHAPVRAKDSVEASGWSHKRLTDGERLFHKDEANTNQPGHAAVLLRKEIRLDKPIRRATAFLCGLGYSEFEINGRRIADAVLDPGFTDFSRRVLYRTYDVTDALQRGPNVLGVTLGGGWFDLATPDLFGFENAPWAATPRVLCQLCIEFADGMTRTVVSDKSWKWSTGAITFNCVRGGETIDARQDKPGWSSIGYDDAAWYPAMRLDPPRGRLVSQQHPAIRVTASLRPVKLTEPQPGVYVFDLGVNVAGWARLITSGPRGTRVKLEYNELLNPDGTLNTRQNTSHTHGRFQTEEFILRGEGKETFEPRFTYHGFRYVQVTGLAERPTLDSLTGRWVTTDLERAGEFSCSNRRINTIQDLIVRTYLNNMHGIPTDCPQREKMGWMDDGCVCMETGFYNLDTPVLYRKWLRDMMDAQEQNGHVPDFVPTCGWGRSGADGSPGAMADPWWGGAIVMAPWKLHLHYGDIRVLEEGYPAMKAYVDYLGTRAKGHLIDWGLCDWLANSAGADTPPQTHLSTAAYGYQARLVSQTAALLDRKDEASRYAALAEQIRDAFNQKNLNAATGWYVSNSQTGQAVPLALNLVPKDLRHQVFERLVDSITDSRDGHVAAGIVGLANLFRALMEDGRDDLAYCMVVQEEYPGWLHMVNNGATSIWEAWNGDASRNHPTLGCIGSWFYEGLAGIRPDPAEPGFKHILIKPAVVGDLTWVRAHYDSPYGRIVSHWKRLGETLTMHVTIPANTTATVYVPTSRPEAVQESGRAAAQAEAVQFHRAEGGIAVYEVGSGRYIFETPLYFRGSITAMKIIGCMPSFIAAAVPIY